MVSCVLSLALPSSVPAHHVLGETPCLPRHGGSADLWLNVQYAIQDGSGNGLRHTFDAMIAGAVPIMLWEMAFSLYKQYLPSKCQAAHCPL